MPNTISRLTSSVPKFVAISKTVCRTYREFDAYTEKEIVDWLILALRLQADVKDKELQQVIIELESAIRCRS